jgi:hypothetical protein
MERGGVIDGDRFEPAPQLLRTVRIREAKTALKSTPLVRDVIEPLIAARPAEPASSRGPAPGEGRLNPA